LTYQTSTGPCELEPITAWLNEPSERCILHMTVGWSYNSRVVVSGTLHEERKRDARDDAVIFG